jgi:hypothetical protein
MNLCLIACSLVVRTIFVTWAKGEEDEHFARLDNVPIKSFPVVYEPENPKGLSNYTAIMSEQVDFVGIRIRLNPPVFEETARLFCECFSVQLLYINFSLDFKYIYCAISL